MSIKDYELEDGRILTLYTNEDYKEKSELGLPVAGLLLVAVPVIAAIALNIDNIKSLSNKIKKGISNVINSKRGCRKNNS